MSIPVSLEDLREAIDVAASSPYLLTVGGDGRPHCVGVSVDWRADTLVAAVGNTTLTNGTARPLVSLVWPPTEPGGHTLIVDATATDGPDRQLVLQPTGAVWHRTVTTSGPAGSSGTSDCRPVGGT